MAAEQTSRFEARLPASVYATLKRAGELQGRTLTDFVVGAAHEAARRAIEEETVLRQSAQDQRRFAEATHQSTGLELAKKLPRYPSVPAVLLGWLGRDLGFQGAGVGSLLLYDAISRVAKSPAGVYAICADAIDEAATAFYLAHQYQALASRPQSLYLPMQTALVLVGPDAPALP